MFRSRNDEIKRRNVEIINREVEKSSLTNTKK